MIGKDADYDLSNLPQDKEWLLVIGNHKIIGDPIISIISNGYSLFRKSTIGTVIFRSGSSAGLKPTVTGLSFPEPWGTWSQSDIVTFQFLAPLPQEFDLYIIANAFGPNITGEFDASIGASSVRFKLLENVEERVVRLKNPEGRKILEIKIPNPISPKELGLSGDDRRLGIGLVDIKIIPIKKAP